MKGHGDGPLEVGSFLSHILGGGGLSGYYKASKDMSD